MHYVIPPAPAVAALVAGSTAHFPVRRVYCVGRNYAAHAREMGFDPDRDAPFFFCKPADAIVSVAAGSTAELAYPVQTRDFHHEIELVVAIGKAGSDIPLDQAAAHVWGYAVGLDMTRRDLQLALREKGRPWELGKSFDASGPIGPIVPAAQAPGIDSAQIRLDVNGARRQQSTIAHLIWSVPETIAYLSTYFRLMPGDLIFTGTPEGVGAVQRGDQMLGEIDGLGELALRVA